MSGLLSGKSALVTGANRGLGRAVASLFAQNGAALWACARAETPEFAAFCSDLAAANGVSVTPLYFDVAESDQVAAAVKLIAAAKTPVDILVNNAGLAHGGLFQMTPGADIQKVFQTNFFGAVELTSRLTRLMARQKKGAVVNVASASGIDGRSGNIAYGTSKAALILATRTMAQELAASGIRVNAVAPGAVATDMLEQMEDKAREKLVSGNAMNRAGTPEEVAQAVLFLASDMASYITGQTLRVDGGAV